MPHERNLWRLTIRCWLPVILWMAFIFVVSSQPKASMPHHPNGLFDWGIKKSAHMIEYGILAMLVWRAISGCAGATIRRSQIWLIPLFCIAYAATDEYHQSFVPGRSSSVWDILIDGLGVLLTLVIVSLLLKQRARRLSGFFFQPWLTRFLDGFSPLRPVVQDNLPE